MLKLLCDGIQKQSLNLKDQKISTICFICVTLNSEFRPTQKPEDDHDYQFPIRYINRFLSFGRKYLKINQRQEDREQGTSLNSEIDFLQAGQQLNRWRRAAQYLEAGVKFKKRDYDKLYPHTLLDIRFHNSAMELPCLVIDEFSATLFRNLIAFEQTCPQFGDDFTAYIVFLSQLISMPEDVTLLAQREIIVHHLESDERVSDLFTLLSKDVVFDFNGNYYLKSLCQTMEAHYQSRINRWMAWLWVHLRRSLSSSAQSCRPFMAFWRMLIRLSRCSSNRDGTGRVPTLLKKCFKFRF